MLTILTTSYRQIVEAEALAIVNTLQKKGYCNIQSSIKITYSVTFQWEVCTTPEIISAMGWE
jgi:hypothetical protein